MTVEAKGPEGIVRISGRTTRVKACELAAQCMQGQCDPSIGVGSRLMSLVVFFEVYIAEGADECERRMKLLSRDVRGAKRKNWRVIAGGAMGRGV